MKVVKIDVFWWRKHARLTESRLFEKIYLRTELRAHEVNAVEKRAKFWSVFGRRNFNGRGSRNLRSIIDESNLKQLPITVQNFVAMRRRVSENEDLILK